MTENAATVKKPLKLVPRMKDQGYSREDVDFRRKWLEEETGCRLNHVGRFSFPAEEMRGNIENPIGAAQVPLGAVGPILVMGDHAQGLFYVPMATTEGALLRSYERGMVLLTRAGGVSCHIHRDENCLAPSFFFKDVAEAAAFAAGLPKRFETLKSLADATTRHGRLLGVEPHVAGREVMVNFRFFTGDANGMNMVAKAVREASDWLVANTPAQRYLIFSGLESEKRASGFLFSGGKGKKVTAGVRLSAKLLKTYLRVTPQELHHLWEHTVIGHFQANSTGFNAHLANGLAAIFIACGQDVANVVNAATGISHLELEEDGGLYASTTLSSLTVGTVGGGVGLGTGRECLETMGCFGTGKARKFAEIVAATLLAGEISFSAAIASGEFVDSHETYGRNRPEP